MTHEQIEGLREIRAFFWKAAQELQKVITRCEANDGWCDPWQAERNQKTLVDAKRMYLKQLQRILFLDGFFDPADTVYKPASTVH